MTVSKSLFWKEIQVPNTFTIFYHLDTLMSFNFHRQGRTEKAYRALKHLTMSMICTSESSHKDLCMTYRSPHSRRKYKCRIHSQFFINYLDTLISPSFHRQYRTEKAYRVLKHLTMSMICTSESSHKDLCMTYRSLYSGRKYKYRIDSQFFTTYLTTLYRQ